MKIINCGLAATIKKDSMEYICCGSPGFTAPEVLYKVGYGLKADVFSCGIILYILYITL